MQTKHINISCVSNCNYVSVFAESVRSSSLTSTTGTPGGLQKEISSEEIEETEKEEEEEQEQSHEETVVLEREEAPIKTSSSFKRPTTLSFGSMGTARHPPSSYLHEFREAREQGRSSFLSSSKSTSASRDPFSEKVSSFQQSSSSSSERSSSSTSFKTACSPGNSRYSGGASPFSPGFGSCDSPGIGEKRTFSSTMTSQKSTATSEKKREWNTLDRNRN